MTDRPILFSAPMVRALLNGRKTQTRRILKPQPDTTCATFERVFKTAPHFEARSYEGKPIYPFPAGRGFITPFPSIKFDIGDRLWVRESWQLHSRATDFCTVAYMASVNHSGWSEAHEQFPDSLAGNMRTKPFQEGWRPSIHMPRWASRLTLIVTDVRVERLQDISEADARAEGLQYRLDWLPQWRGADQLPWRSEFPRDAFQDLWDSINGNREGASWQANPWVVAISFTVAQQNIDQ